MALPFGYSDVREITRTPQSAGFDAVEHAEEARVGNANSVDDAVRGIVDGSPLAAELEQEGLLIEGRDAVRRAVQEAFGDESIEVPMKAIVFSATSSGS